MSHRDDDRRGDSRERRGGDERSRDSRVYVGNLSSRVTERDLEKDFERFGKIERVDLKNGYGFVNFDHPADASAAVKAMDRTTMEGRDITVEMAKGPRAARNVTSARGAGGGKQVPYGRPYRRPGVSTGFGVLVEYLDQRTSWQDLKDFARKCGEPAFADVWTERNGRVGLMEYHKSEDMKKALRELDDTKLDGVYVRLRADPVSDRRRSYSRSPSPRRRSSSPKRSRRSHSRSPAKDDRKDRSPRRESRKDDDKVSESKDVKQDKKEEKSDRRSRSPPPRRSRSADRK